MCIVRRVRHPQQMKIFFLPFRRVLLGFVWWWMAMLAVAGAQIGGLDAGFSPGAILNGAAPGVVRAVLVQSDGKTIIAGDFTSVGGTARGCIARLNENGTLDPAFAAAAGANGPVNAMALQSDGKIVIGGEFTTFDGSPRNRILRLTTTGALDATFTPGTGANGAVQAVLVSEGFGAIQFYLGGDFTQVNGLPRGRLARLDSAGTVDFFMDGATGPNATVHALALGPGFSTTLYVGGAFTTFNGVARNRLAASSTSSGSLSSAFNASGGPDGTVYAMLLNPNPGSSSSVQMVIGGDFFNVGTSARARIASLIAPSFSSQSFTVEPGFTVFVDARVRCLAFQAGGSSSRLLVGGDFTQVNGQARNRIARIYATGGSSGGGGSFWDLDTTFNSPAGANGTVRALAVTSEAKPVLGGEFSGISGTPTQSVARLYSDAGSQPPATPAAFSVVAASASQIIVTFNVSANASLYKIERSLDGASGWVQAALQGATQFLDAGLAAGVSYFYRVTARNSNGDSVPTSVISATTAAVEWSGAGALDPASAAGSGAGGTINAVAFEPDGAILVAGSFTTLHGVARNRLARLLPDWTVDPSFDPGVGANSTINGLAVQPDGKIIIVGSFSTVAGVARNAVARLTATGALDTGFVNPGSGPSGSVSQVAVQPDGRVLIAGSFSNFNGTGIKYLARLNANGSFDPTFQGAPGTSVDSLSVQRDGRILLGGFFFNGVDVNGLPSKYVARLTPDGEVDPTFHPGDVGAFLNSVGALNNGKIFIGGSFTTVAGSTRNRIARLNADGSLDATFDPGTGPDSSVNRITPQPDGKVLIAGSFTKVGGVLRPHLARLNADGTLDATFQPGAGTFGVINSVAVGPDTRIVIGGEFMEFGVGQRNRLARLNGDGEATPPPTPTGLSVMPVSSSSLLVAWSDLPAEHGWKLERSPDGSSGWVPLPTLPWDVTTFTDTGLAAGTIYFYRLRSANSAGDSSYSSSIPGRTLSLYEQWKVNAGFLSSAPNESDADADGIRLIVEYGLGLDPTAPSSDGLPPFQRLGDFVAFSYRKFRGDVNYTVEASTDLQTWSADGVNQGSGSFPIAWKIIGGAPQLFLRLRVSLP